MPSSSTTLPFRRVYTGMPVYNGEKYIEQSLRSNLAQSFDDFGIIIADNASTDRTEEICRDFAASDQRIVYRRNPQNLGAAKNYSACFDPANCDYFRWSNADDLIDPELITRGVKVLDEHSDVVLTYGKTRLINGNDELIRFYDDNLHIMLEDASERFLVAQEKLGLSNVLYGLMRRSELAKTALFGSFVASDLNLILEMTLYGKFYEMKEIMFARRIHEEASSFDREDQNVQRAFWDPAKRRLLMQNWRAHLEFFKAVRRAPLTKIQRRRLFKVLSKKMWWSKGELTQELAQYLRYGLLQRS